MQELDTELFVCTSQLIRSSQKLFYLVRIRKVGDLKWWHAYFVQHCTKKCSSFPKCFLVNNLIYVKVYMTLK